MKKNFKFAAIGCGGIIAFAILVGILAAIFDPEDSNEKSSISKQDTTLDTLAIQKENQIADSIATVNKEKKLQAEADLKKFKKNTDEFEGSSFYRDPRTPNYTNVNFVYPYIGEKNNSYWLRLKMQYAADDWLFINKAIFLVDGETFPVTGNWERDNSGGQIWEWIDMPVEESGIPLLQLIANSKTTKLRYEGNQYRNDREITNKEKDIIKKTLEIYRGLKN